MQTVEAVIFDLDGLLINSEQAWDDVRREFVAEQGGHWQDRAAARHDGHELDRVVVLTSATRSSVDNVAGANLGRGGRPAALHRAVRAAPLPLHARRPGGRGSGSST